MSNQSIESFEAFHGSIIGSPLESSFLRRREQPKHVNQPLPEVVKDRYYIGASTQHINISLIPGNIFKKQDNNSMTKVSLKPCLLDRFFPATVIKDELLYSNRINKWSDFNGSFIIANFKVEDDKMLEVRITDVIASTVHKFDDGLVVRDIIDVDAIKRFRDELISRGENIDNYFFGESAILTTVHTAGYVKREFDAGFNTTYITAGGKTYMQYEEFSSNNLISIGIVPLNAVILDPA